MLDRELITENAKLKLQMAYYHDIALDICAQFDEHDGGHLFCGNVDDQNTQVQDRVKELIEDYDRLDGERWQME